MPLIEVGLTQVYYVAQLQVYYAVRWQVNDAVLIQVFFAVYLQVYYAFYLCYVYCSKGGAPTMRSVPTSLRDAHLLPPQRLVG
jgi:hypothetical protein